MDFSQTFFLFMMMGLYFQTFNTVRYYLALALALYSMKYVLERDGIKFVFWIVVAAFFTNRCYWCCRCTGLLPLRGKSGRLLRGLPCVHSASRGKAWS